ncbi:potassium/proton antiporter [Solirubrobacter sp. CPCC 204708]|uniref:Potassium/proton antiporter n=1 Tax=Solirubrobacter deserti TaxID=2282478 RepID=A0ABT4RH29_9ACTN|nr:potassium/proton antiporter [Solirubrobacter deserti]MBE2315160.1 potassium/proton antiporter [Solirubrobacter deserti]MDA0137843.1 potassium/proton antiporter [Solirubrobacter deserti]
MDVGFLALAVGSLLAAGIAASLLAGRLRLPGLVLVLVLGMVIGTDGLTLIDFQDYEVAQSAAVLALALILYEGGLSSGWAEIKPVVGPSIMLATLGTLLTAGLTAVAALWLFDELTGLEAFVLGSTVAATDAAAVFAVLRGSTLRRRLARTLEGESGVNDPIAILLVIGGIEAINHADFGLVDALWLAASELAIGAAVGLAVGALGVIVLRQVTLPSAGLYPVASIAFAAIAYGGAQTAHGTGFLAVFLAGLVIGSASSPARRTVITFHEGLAWVAQLALFLLLGLLVNPAELIEFIPEGAAIAIVTAVIARPLAALLVAYGFTLPERLILGWAGLRGATPIVFATFPVTEGLPHGETIFKVAFFVVLLSTVLQGLTIEPVARWLGVTSDEAALPVPLVEPVILNRLGAETMQFPVRHGDAIEGRLVRDLGLPREALLNVIVRGDRAIPPRGSTAIQEGDQLHVLVRQEVAMDFRDLMRRWRTGPVGPPERPRRQPRSRPSVTTIRPWAEADGDPQRPKTLAGQPVVEQLRTRRDEPGALVALEDGRYGVSGPLLAIGPSGELQAFARRRLANAKSPAERAWWQEVVGALAR